MIISDFGLKPEQTIYYIAGQILQVLKQRKTTEQEILNSLFGASPQPYEIYRFNLSLYMLLLLGKFKYFEEEGKLIYVYQEIRNQNDSEDDSLN
ncbi:MAG: hypothetical protein LBV19_01545 [Streptococcaceae bacterium]|nr:hypothetical protein [Streptococcaceae bacterium]